MRPLLKVKCSEEPWNWVVWGADSVKHEPGDLDL